MKMLLMKPHGQEFERILCHLVQKESYVEELKCIIADKPVPRETNLYQLLPYKTDDEILRVNGRRDAVSCLLYTTKRPIIFPPNHEFTRLVATNVHEKILHENVE